MVISGRVAVLHRGRVGPGASVTLAVAPEACVPLPGGGDGEPTGDRRME